MSWRTRRRSAPSPPPLWVRRLNQVWTWTTRSALGVGTVLVLTPLSSTSWRLSATLWGLSALGALDASRLVARALKRTGLGGRGHGLAAALITGVAVLVWLVQPLGFALGSPWQTVSVYQRHTLVENYIVAHQMRDIGALGYARRMTKSLELGLFRWDTVIRSGAPMGGGWRQSGRWRTVNETRNPFGWKGG